MSNKDGKVEKCGNYFFVLPLCEIFSCNYSVETCTSYEFLQKHNRKITVCFILNIAIMSDHIL